MRKIPQELENPIDDALLEAADATMPVSKKFTPNQVTVGSIFLAVVAVWAMFSGRPWTFALSYSGSIFLDYVDGHLARTTGQITKIGDFLDHASDALLALAVVAFLAWKLGSKSVVPISIIAIFGFLQAVHLGYQQKWYDLNGDKTEDHHEESLDALQKLAPGDPEEAMRYTRWFGVGTYHVALLYVVLIYGFRSRR
jgi:hypothetical protein